MALCLTGMPSPPASGSEQQADQGKGEWLGTKQGAIQGVGVGLLLY
jgi:hypothetical protein